MRKECGQGEIENIGGEVKLGYNQVRREKNRSGNPSIGGFGSGPNSS
jgi:hypothetical protein